MNTARALLIDLDGVLREWPVEVDRGRVPGLDPGAVRAELFAPALLHRAVTGLISDEQWQLEAAERLRALTGVECVADLIRARAYPGSTNHDVLKLVRRARQRVPVCLVTNATSRLDDHLAQLQLTAELDHVVNSSQIGIAKPDIRIFEYACELLRTTPSDAFYIDDTPEHVTAAASIGIRSHVFTTPEAFGLLLRNASIID